MTATTMNVNAVIDQAKFKPFHLTVVCGAYSSSCLTAMI